MTVCNHHGKLEEKIDKVMEGISDIKERISDRIIESERRTDKKIEKSNDVRLKLITDNEKAHDEIWHFIRKMDKRAAVYIAATAGIGGLLGFMFKYGIL